MKTLFNLTVSILSLLLLASSSMGQQCSTTHTAATDRLFQRLALLGLQPQLAFMRARTGAAHPTAANQTAAFGKVYNFASVDFPGAALSVAEATNGRSDVGLFNFDPNNNSSPGQSFTHSANKYKIYAVPGAAETALLDMNSLGVMAGSYYDSSNVSHGFIDNAGAIATVDFPGSTWTDVRGINDNSDVVGTYYDANGGFHGYAEIGGIFTTLDYSTPAEPKLTLKGSMRQDRSLAPGPTITMPLTVLSGATESLRTWTSRARSGLS